jgi:hypothetical protein
MSKHNIGDRIGAILSADGSTVNLLGYGVYAGDEIPPTGFAHDAGIKNPKLQLDNGKVVWGQECWWGSEQAVKNSIGDRVVVEATMPEVTP